MFSKQKLTHKNNTGFTLVEAVIALTLMGIVAVVLFGFIFSSFNANNDADIRATLANDVQTALNRIEEDIALSSGFNTTTASPFTDPFGPDDAGAAWSHSGSSSSLRTIIINGYATTTHPKNINKSPVYVNTYGCTTDVINSNTLLTTRIIYFIKNGNLYRRTLTDTTKTLCNPQYQKQTCPVGLSHATCLDNDVLLLENVNNFTVNYYTAANGTSALAVYTTPSLMSTAKTAEFTIGVSKTVSGTPYTYQSTIRATKLN